MTDEGSPGGLGGPTDTAAVLRGLMTAIDEHRWSDLPAFLHPDFVCELVHTGETFGRDEWVRFNAEYPGFERLRVEELVAGPSAAACRSHVTGLSERGLEHFACASFARFTDGRISRLTEVWTDLGADPPPDTRPV